MTDINYPPPGFYFTVAFSNEAGAFESSFQEVNGISMEMETESITEGNENVFSHKLPKQPNFSNLVLKRGLLSRDAELLKWVQDTLSGGLAEVIKPQNLFVNLMDTESKPIMSWIFYDAYPVKYSLSDLNTNSNDVAVESIEFTYSFFQQENQI